MNANDYGYGAEWLRGRGKVVSEEGARCAELLNEWQLGIYHIDSEVMRASWDRNFVELTIYAGGGLHTFDNDLLTRLVFLAHDHCIRVSIEPCNPTYLRLRLHPRVRETEAQYRLYYRHPRLMEAMLTHCRQRQPAPFFYKNPSEGTEPTTEEVEGAKSN